MGKRKAASGGTKRRAAKAPDELTLLFEISQALDRSLDIRDAVGPVLELIPRHTGMMRGTLSLLDRATGAIFIEAAHGL